MDDSRIECLVDTAVGKPDKQHAGPLLGCVIGSTRSMERDNEGVPAYAWIVRWERLHIEDAAARAILLFTTRSRTADMSITEALSALKTHTQGFGRIMSEYGSDKAAFPPGFRYEKP